MDGIQEWVLSAYTGRSGYTPLSHEYPGREKIRRANTPYVEKKEEHVVLYDSM